MDKIKEFHIERIESIKKMSKDSEVSIFCKKFHVAVSKYDYAYNLNWMGVPILQLATDIISLQEIIWKVKPDLIIETGLAYGGSLIFSASMLELLGKDGLALGIDIEIREHNRRAIENHSMYKRIKLIEGSSTDQDVIRQVEEIAKNKRSVLVLLDSNHTHTHVSKELELYSKFVTVNSYIIVFDTIIEFLDNDLENIRPQRLWGVGNNPWTAAQDFLKSNDCFEIDTSITEKTVFTSAPGGYLKRVF